MPGPQLPLRSTLGWLGGLVREDSLLLGVAVVAMVTAAVADLAIPHCIAAGVFAASQQRSRAALSASLARLMVGVCLGGGAVLHGIDAVGVGGHGLGWGVQLHTRACVCVCV